MTSPIPRRTFLQESAALAGMAVAGSSLAPLELIAGEQSPTVSDTHPPIIDTHQHLWDLDKLTLPWLKGDSVKSLRRSFVTKDYLAATRGQNVVKTVYMEVNVAKDDQVQEAEYVLELCRDKDNPMAAAVIGGWPHDADFAAYAKKYAADPHIKGVRTVLHDPDRQQGLCLEPRFVENIQLLGKLGLSFDLCMRPGELLDGAKLAEKCPGTRFVLDHCGNMPVGSDEEKLRRQWQQGIKALAGLENTVCKISGIIVTAAEDWKPADLAPNMNFCMDTFGEDRAYFAGDWPVCTLRASFAQWADALRSIVSDRSPAFQRKLFHDNAAKFYGLT